MKYRSENFVRMRSLLAFFNSAPKMSTVIGSSRESKPLRRVCNQHGTHIYVMYPAPAELTFLLYTIILTNPIVENVSQAKLRRESNSKLVQRFPPYAALLRHGTVVANLQKLAFINPRFVRKKQGSAGAGYISKKCVRYCYLMSLSCFDLISYLFSELTMYMENTYNKAYEGDTTAQEDCYGRGTLPCNVIMMLHKF